MCQCKCLSALYLKPLRCFALSGNPHGVSVEMVSASLAPLPEHPLWVGQPLNLEKKPRASKIMCPDQVRCIDPARKDGQLASLHASLDMLCTKGALLEFHPKEGVTVVGKDGLMGVLRANTELQSTTHCFKQGSCPCRDHTAAGSASLSTISIT